MYTSPCCRKTRKGRFLRYMAKTTFRFCEFLHHLCLTNPRVFFNSSARRAWEKFRSGSGTSQRRMRMADLESIADDTKWRTVRATLLAFSSQATGHCHSITLSAKLTVRHLSDSLKECLISFSNTCVFLQHS